MLLEGALAVGLLIAAIAFVAEYVDSTLGMGYGTTLTPILLLMGFNPLQVVPAVLFSELITGILAGLAHHSVGNVNFALNTGGSRQLRKRLRSLGYVETFRRSVPTHLKIALAIACCSVVGTLVAVFVAVSISTFYLKVYIGALVAAVGVFTVLTARRRIPFSWPRMTGLSLLASFNKAMSGGGYGPVVTGGQLLCGVDGRSAVAITSLAEGLTCLVGFTAFLLVRGIVDWTLFPYLVIGAVLSVPLSAYTIKRLKPENLRVVIGLFAIGLGLWTLARTLS